jgi:hypothetical protein
MTSIVAFDSETMTKALTEAGLPARIHHVIDRMYCFSCEHGSHYRVLAGKVTAISLSDEGGLVLHVTSPNFWGGGLANFFYNHPDWYAHVIFLDAHKDFKGILRLL